MFFLTPDVSVNVGATLLIQEFVTFFRILYICLMFLRWINKSDNDDEDLFVILS